ncbi:hypothetical protein Pan216_51390 [Planctomycetes bacterium Pan216]|uniref:Uncharacterized protein n=1 Tax=Kolteria novifilia TaxID=2527975 RepID=A0A518BBB4_9BACT|nr:hypothetical protein Pan216_51390 [Planctomycetes bacterium Pan216]
MATTAAAILGLISGAVAYLLALSTVSRHQTFIARMSPRLLGLLVGLGTFLMLMDLWVHPTPAL